MGILLLLDKKKPKGFGSKGHQLVQSRPKLADDPLKVALASSRTLTIYEASPARHSRHSETKACPRHFRHFIFTRTIRAARPQSFYWISHQMLINTPGKSW
jgi:hypothetical protein